MINFYIKEPDVHQTPGRPGWLVTHPENGAILAQCDTNTEARQVAEAFKMLGAMFEQTPESFYKTTLKLTRDGKKTGAP